MHNPLKKSKSTIAGWMILSAVFLAPKPLSAAPLMVMADGVPCVALTSYLEAQGFQTGWDPMMKNLSARAGAGSLVFHVGSEYALGNGRLIRLGGKVRFHKGLVALPSAALRPLEQAFNLPSIEPMEKRWARPALRRIVLDAGHGGKDDGAVAPDGLQEKNVVLEVAKYVRQELEREGVQVVMTRDTDIFIPLSDRARRPIEESAEFFVSIHANASPSPSLKGFEVYHLSPAAYELAPEAGDADRRHSIRMAGSIVEAVRSTVPTAERRIRDANFFVLKWSHTPAVLVEIGYLTNDEDRVLLEDPQYLRGMAKGIAAGILGFKKENDDG